MFGLLPLLAATSAMAQVQVDLRLEKARYLAGEPIVVVVDVRNIGDEAVGYSSCDGRVRLAVTGAERRRLPNVFGCFASEMGGGGGCGVDHPPLLSPGQTATFRYLLKEYDLRPGQYELTAAGKAGVRWKYYPVYAPNVPPPPPPTHTETDPVPGAQFDRVLALNIVASSQRELQSALAPLASAAVATDPVRRHHARAAIVESAPPFLDSLIARFAAEDQFDHAAIDALRRIATPRARVYLKTLVRRRADARRSASVLALARVGHRDDLAFLATVLQDATVDDTSRRYAALGLGHIGGNQAVRSLDRALRAAPPEGRPSIATALGNTRSRVAVPVLIDMFGDDLAHNDVCGALLTLTHRTWCGGTADDPAATRRQWLRRWNEDGSKAPIFGPDTCPSLAVPVQVPTTGPPGRGGRPALTRTVFPLGRPEGQSARPSVIARLIGGSG